MQADPLFKKISTTIDEEGVDGMLLNQIAINSDGCGLMLDASLVPTVEDSAIISSKERTDSCSNSLTELKGVILIYRRIID